MCFLKIGSWDFFPILMKINGPYTCAKSQIKKYWGSEIIGKTPNMIYGVEVLMTQPMQL